MFLKAGSRLGVDSEFEHDPAFPTIFRMFPWKGVLIISLDQLRIVLTLMSVTVLPTSSPPF